MKPAALLASLLVWGTAQPGMADGSFKRFPLTTSPDGRFVLGWGERANEPADIGTKMQRLIKQLGTGLDDRERSVLERQQKVWTKVRDSLAGGLTEDFSLHRLHELSALLEHW
ncbi:MAG: hypothetical protein K1X78_08065 [Verrucomicrobiaceae bacterium]|nr:hypothetical protein [Verrucomicrobiaceae bacterium]